MKLFLCLGNIGEKYEKTRHNVGFLLADFLQKKWGFSSFREEKKFFGALSEGEKRGEKILLVKPNTFMNRSGQCAQAVAHFYKIPLEDILLLFDDKDQDFENIRFREKGSSGGHNGLKDIFQKLGTEEIPRIKMGVANEKMPHFQSTADFVLSNFSKEEQNSLASDVFPRVEEKINVFLSQER